MRVIVELYAATPLGSDHMMDEHIPYAATPLGSKRSMRVIVEESERVPNAKCYPLQAQRFRKHGAIMTPEGSKHVENVTAWIDPDGVAAT